MKTPIPAIEKVIAERANSTEENINIRLFWAYKHNLEAGNDLINFYDVIWERDIEGIVENLNYYKINEFSISSNFSGLITILAAFDKYGFTLSRNPQQLILLICFHKNNYLAYLDFSPRQSDIYTLQRR